MKLIGALLIILLIMIMNVPAQAAGNREDYWIVCENTNGEADMLNKLKPEDMNKLKMELVYPWTQLKESCITNCTWFQMWKVDGNICVEYQINQGARI